MTEEEKKDYNYVIDQLCKTREIICSMILEYKKQREIKYDTMQKAKELLRKGVFSENL